MFNAERLQDYSDSIVNARANDSRHRRCILTVYRG